MSGGAQATVTVGLNDQLSAGLQGLTSKVTSFSSAVSSGMSGAGSSAASFGSAVQSGMGRAISSIQGVASASMNVAASVSGAVLGIGAGFMALGEKAAKAESVWKSFSGSMAKGGQDAKAELDKLRAASLGMVNDQELMTKTTMGTMLIGSETMNRFGGNTAVMSKLLNVAQASARATGQDVNYLFESVVKGVARASPMILDNLGLSIKLEDAYSEFAASIGKLPAALTPAEQKSAILNQVLKQGQGFIEEYGISAGGVRTKQQQFGTAVENTAIKIGTTFLPVMAKLYDIALLVMSGVDKLIPFFTALFSAIGAIPTPIFGALAGFVALAGGAKALALVAGPLSALIPGLGAVIAALGPYLLALAAPVAIAVGLLLAFQSNFMGFRDAVMGALAPLLPMAQSVAHVFGMLQSGVSQAFAAFQAAQGTGAGVFDSLTFGLQTLAYALQSTPLFPLFQALANASLLLGPAFDAVGAALQGGLAAGLVMLNPLLSTFAVFLQTVGLALQQVFAGDLVGGITTFLGALLTLDVTATAALRGLVLAAVTTGLEFAISIAGWVFGALPGFVASLGQLVMSIGAWVSGSLLPMLVASGTQAAASLAGWVAQAIPALLGGLATLGSTIVMGLLTVYPMLTTAVYSWAGALVGWISTATAQISANWPTIRDTVVGLIVGGITSIGTTVLGWATALASWIPGAIGMLASGIGTLIGSAVRFLISAVPQLIGAVLQWAVNIADFAYHAIPGALMALGNLLAAIIAWIITSGVPMVISAAAKLATGLVSGFLNAIQGKSGGIQAAATTMPAAVAKGAGAPGPWAAGGQHASSGVMGIWDKIKTSIAAGAGPATAVAKGAAGQVAGAMAPAAGMMPGGGGGAGGGGAAKAPAGGAAGQDPAQAAMQAVQGTVSALNGVMDFAEKAFKFRGFPPPEVMDLLFKGLKDIIKRAIDLSKGMDPQLVELASAVGQMAQGWVSALTGMVDLAEKMARFRPPTANAEAQLFAMAKWLLGAADALTKLFQGGKGLEEALAKAAISSKVAETLKLWAEFFKTLAEATIAMAHGRWEIDLTPVLTFVTRLAGFVVSITQALQTQLGPTLRVVLADAMDVANTLKPWADLMKSIAELTGSLARARWNVDPSPAEAFIQRLAVFALSMLASLKTQLGPALLLAMDDTKLVAETLKVWMEPLAKLRDVTISMARMRPVDPAGAEGFIISLIDMSLRFTAMVKTRLGPALLVGLDDSKAVADTLGAWLGPLEKVGAVSASIDAVRGSAQRRTDTSFGALTAFLFGLTAVLAGYVSAARSVLGPMILVALEDSREIAGALGAWLGPLEKVGAVADSIDKVRGQAKLRTDSSFGAVGAFLMGLATTMGNIVSGAQGALGSAILVALETSSEVAKAFVPWLDMLAKAGAAMDSIDKVTAYAQQRMDTSLGPVFDLLLELGARGYAIVAAVQAFPNPTEFLGVSEVVAKTFGAWLDMLTKVGASVESIRKVGRLQGGELAASADFLRAIATEFAAGVIAVSRWPDPSALQGVSVTVAGTFGAWLDMLAKMGGAITAMTGLDRPDPAVVQTAAGWLLEIAGTFAPLVLDLNRRSDPKMVQTVSTAIAATIGAWVDMLTKAASMVDKLVNLEPVRPEQWDIIAAVVQEAISRAVSLSADIRAMVDVAREALIAGVTDYTKVAEAAIGLFDKAAGLGAKLAAAVRPTPDGYSVVAGVIEQTFGWVRSLAAELMPRLRSEAGRMGTQIAEFTKSAGDSLGLFDKAAGLGAKMASAVAPTPGDFELVGGIIRQVFYFVRSLAADLLPGLASEQRRAGEQVGLFVRMSGDSVGLFDKAAGLGAKLRAAVEPTLGQYILVSSVIAGAVRQVASLAGDILPRAQTEAAGMVAQIDLFNKIAGPSIDLVLKAAGVGEALRSAVAVSADRLGFVRDGVMAIVVMVGALASEWVAAQTRMSQSVEDMKAFSGVAASAVGVIKPAVDALLALANPSLLPASYRALAFVSAGIAQIVPMIEAISSGYRTATGELDTARTSGIEAFAKTAQAALGPVKDVVDVLTKLTESQGKLGGLTPIIKTQIKTGIVALVDIMGSLSTGYKAGEIEGRLALGAVADFSKSVGDIVKPIGDVIKTLDDVWKFAFAPDKNNADKMVPVARDFGAKAMGGIKLGIEALISTMAGVQRSLGPELLAQAKAAADVAGPVAGAIGAMVEPMAKLLENPFVDAKKRSSSVGANAAQTRIKALAGNVEKGIKIMAETLIRALTGITVPDGLENGVNRLLAVVSGLMASVQQAMQMPPIDFGKIEDLVRAANMLAGAQVALGSGAGGGMSFPSTGGGGGGGGAGGGSGQPREFVIQGPVTLELSNAVITGDVAAVGPVDFKGTQQITVTVEGQTIQETSRTGAFKTGSNREGRNGRQA